MNRLVLFVWLLTLAGCSVGNPAVARAAAKKHATDLGYKVIGVACTSTDTDGDGYIACSVRVEGSQDPLALECTRGEWTFTDGSKMAMAKLRVNQTITTP